MQVQIAFIYFYTLSVTGLRRIRDVTHRIFEYKKYKKDRSEKAIRRTSEIT